MKSPIASPWVWIAAVVLLFSAWPVAAAGCVDYGIYWREVGELPSLTGSCVALSGDLAFVGHGARFEVIDIHDETAPVSLAGLDLTATVRDIEVAGSLAYLASGADGLTVLDVNQPTHPVLIARRPVPGTANGVAVQGNHAYVAAGDGGVVVFDVSEFLIPVIVGVLATTAYVQDVRIDGNVLYCACASDGVLVADVGDPTSPQLLATLEAAAPATNLALAGDLLFVAREAAGLAIYDVINPGAPALVSTLDDEVLGSVELVRITDGRAWLATSRGLAAVDVTDPAAPTVLGTTGSANGDLVVRGSRAVVVSPCFMILDLTVPLSPPVMASLELEFPRGMARAGNHAYCATFGPTGGRLHVIDLADPSAPVLVSTSVDTIGRNTDVVIEGNHAYLSCGRYGLRVMDVTDPYDPQLAGSLYLGNGAVRCVVADGHIFIANGLQGVQVVDVADPGALQLVQTLSTRGWGVAVAGSYLLATDANVGLQVYDLANPAAPSLVATLVLPGDPWDVTVAGPHAYVTDEDGGLWCVDITDPRHPAATAYLDLPGRPDRVTVAEGIAYVSDVYGAVHLVDVTDPTAPVRCGNVDCFWYSAVVAADPVTETILVYGGWVPPSLQYGLHVLPIQCSPATGVDAPAMSAAAPRITSVYPNPFNPATTIRWELGQPATVRLTVHDLAGRLIRRLVDDAAVPDGPRETVWDGRDDRGAAAPSGVYIYRLAAGGQAATGRVTLIR